METGRFEINKVCDEVMNIAKDIVGNNEIKSVTRICECYDQGGGDFLQFNAVFHNDKLTIDWGFGGVMPYSLDIARLIAHATEDKATFPFYMNDDQKKYS